MSIDINKRNERLTAVRIFLTLIIVYAFFTNDYLTTNDASRFSLTAAVVENGSAEITDILPVVISDGWKIKDFAVKDNRIYSDKAPFGSFIAIPPYYIFTRLGFSLPWVIYFVSLLTAGMLSAATALLIFYAISIWKRDLVLRTTIALTYGLGTMALFYSTVFFSGAITAFLAFLSFYLLTTGELKNNSVVYQLTGCFVAGLIMLSDYYAGISSVCIIIYGLFSYRRNRLLMVLSFMIPIALLCLYNDIVFGSPFNLSYRFSNLYDQLHSNGIFGLTLPGIDNLKRMIVILFSVKNMQWGFFFSNAVVFFAILSMRKYILFRKQYILIIAMAIGYLYLNSCESWFDAYSARFFMPLLPFLMLPLMSYDFNKRLNRNIYYFVLGFSVIVNVIGTDRFLPERVWDARPGMQNIIGILFANRNINFEIGYLSLLVLIMIIIPIWLVPFIVQKTKEKAEQI